MASSPTNIREDTDPSKLTVCRILVQNLEGALGHATNDYNVDLILSRHGVYDIAHAVFGIAQRAKLTQDRIGSHLWNVSLGNSMFCNGWRRANPLDGSFDRPAGKRDVDEGERRVLSKLETPLRNGQKGNFSGESLKFNLTVQNIAFRSVNEKDVVVVNHNPWELFQLSDEELEQKKKGDEEKKHLPHYPKVTNVAITISGKVESDWIAPYQKTQCLQLQSDWQAYFKGLNSWKRDRRTCDYIRAKPQSPPWNGDEIEIMGLLINSDVKFKKGWTNILQYAFVNRSESACSMKWYQIKGKDRFMIQHVGNRSTDDKRIQLAKRLGKKRMGVMIDAGSPKKEEHPKAKTERMLRKRGKIDDNTSAEEKRRLCALFSCGDFSDGDY